MKRCVWVLALLAIGLNAAPAFAQEGEKPDGAKTDGTKTDGTKTDGTKTDGAKTDGAKTDGAGKDDGAGEGDGAGEDDGAGTDDGAGKVPDKEEGDLAELGDELDQELKKDVRSGGTGSFGYRLTSYGIDPYLHAYITFDYTNFEESKKRNTFDLHYFNVFVGANIRDTIFPEIQLEHEHGAEELTVRFAQVDVKLDERLVIRAGLWLVPFGTYNEFLYPEFISKTPRGPILDGTLRNLIPVAWNDVGVQVRGRFTFTQDKDIELNYVAYISNGLEQKDDAATPQVDDGGNIRDMRGNFRDKNDGHKSVGGRVGFKGFGFSIGTSMYWGAYTVDGNQDLYMYGLDAQYDLGGLQIGIEAIYVVQQRDNRADLYRKGVYAWISYKFENVLGDLLALDVEPVIAIDWVRMGETKEKNRRGYFGGVNLYPFPQILPNMNFRLFYAGYDQNGNEVRDNIFIAQLTLGF